MLKIPDIYNPRYSYGGGKILTELMASIMVKNISKINYISTSQCYGSDMGQEHVIPEFIKRMQKLKNKLFKIKVLVKN